MAARHRRSRTSRSARLDALVPWSPVMIGVGILASYLIYALLPLGGAPLPVINADRGPVATVPAPAPGPVASTAGPPGQQPAGRAGRQAVPVVISPSPTAEPTESPTPDPAERRTPALSAQYRLVDRYWGGFRAQVVIVNESDVGQDWTVELAYGRDVDGLETYWAEGSSQPTASRAGRRYTFTGTSPVEPGSGVVLHLQFDRDGGDLDPTFCRISGESCVAG